MNGILTLFDTAGFPPRWHCGSWTSLHGWVHIVADVSIFAAYVSIPAVIALYALRRKDLPFPRVAWLFAAFIVSCGLSHVIEASIFWHPWYRLSALMKVLTAMVSWLTVASLVRVVPAALTLPGVAALNEALTREVEQRARTARALEAANERLREQALALARSNEALEVFAFTASHDLHEPLRKIVGFSDLLADEKSEMLDDEGRAYLRSILDGGARMQELLRGVLALSRASAESVSMERVDADAALSHALSELRERFAAAGAEVEREPLGTVMGARVQLEQVFQNLLGNALKYRAADRPLRVRVSAVREADTVTISLRDNGSGIDEAKLDEIFAPFRRFPGRSSAPGSGLGLTLCRHIVERLGGSISARRNDTEGLTIVITLAGATSTEAPPSG
ncbi:MAG: ATP-binding protein [Polyangiales bacterium]